MLDSHLIQIWDVNTQSVVASRTVSPSSSTDSMGYKYETFSTPVPLNSGTTYRITSYETYGRDPWFDFGLISNHSGIAVINTSAWSENSSQSSFPESTYGNNNYGHVVATFYTGSGGSSSMLTVASASASSYQSGCTAGNAIDGYADMGHRWNAYDDNYPEWLELDLGSIKSIDRIKTAFKEPSTRLYDYDIEVSTDGCEIILRWYQASSL